MLIRIEQNSPSYPDGLRRYLSNQAPATITALGDLDILNHSSKLALFCSVKCPGNLILQLYDLARELRSQGVTVIGGFHSPMEKECLAILLRGKGSLIICPARSLETMRLPPAWRAPLADKRLLLLSPFAEHNTRSTTKLALARNEFVAALADEIFVAYAEVGSKTEAFTERVINWDKSVSTFNSPANANLAVVGAKPLVKPSLTPVNL
jgi:predicted Rossmann fold nucleotide-binding protein DprA/Smf involved in DNA uptake